MTKIEELLAANFNITGSCYGGGTQELMLNHLGEVTTTQHSQNSWSEYHTPHTCLLSIDSNTDWRDSFWEEDIKKQWISFLQDLDDDIVQNEIINYMYINDVITVPVFDTVPEGFGTEKIDSGNSRVGSCPEYHWEMFAVRDKNNKFVGIYSRQY